MRSIYILAIFGTLLLLPGAGPAETSTECPTACASEKAARDVNCLPSGEVPTESSTQCLKDSQDTFISCIRGCPQPAPADKPAEN